MAWNEIADESNGQNGIVWAARCGISCWLRNYNNSGGTIYIVPIVILWGGVIWTLVELANIVHFQEFCPHIRDKTCYGNDSKVWFFVSWETGWEYPFFQGAFSSDWLSMSKPVFYECSRKSTVTCSFLFVKAEGLCPLFSAASLSCLWQAMLIKEFLSKFWLLEWTTFFCFHFNLGFSRFSIVLKAINLFQHGLAVCRSHTEFPGVGRRAN